MKHHRWFHKKSICGVALQLRRCSVLIRTLHSSVFARLASGAFYETIIPFTFYEIIIREDFPESPSAPLRAGLCFNFIAAARLSVRFPSWFLRALHVGASRARPVMGVCMAPLRSKASFG
jgi:hypothetical protein